MTQSGTGLSNDRRHGNKAKNGWYRYDTRFGIPVYSELGEIERYNIFRARMLVPCDENNKLFLYDVVQIILMRFLIWKLIELKWNTSMNCFTARNMVVMR